MNAALLVEIPASIVPGADALVDDRVSSYHDLAERIARIAGWLERNGVGAGDRVAIVSTNTRRAIEVLFGALHAGVAVAPLNLRARPDELRFLVEDADARLVLAEPRYLDALAVLDGLPARLVALDDAFDAAADAVEPVAEPASVEEEALAVLLYTSGTTSLPKGAMLSHGALSSYVVSRVECADGTDRGRSLLAAPIHHVAAIASVCSALYAGRAVVTLAQFDADAWLDAVARHRVTQAFVVPTMLARIVAAQERAPRDLSSLELVTYGAAPMPPSVIRRALEVFPPTVGFSGAYGQTETTSTVTVLGPDDHRLTGSPAEVEAKRRRLSSVGRAVEDVEIRVVDPEGRPLGPNEVGDVWVRTGRTMSGYWQRGDRTLPQAVDAEGWVHTGDLGSLDEDGYLFLHGRAGDLIIRGGENVAPEEVEAVLYDHPDVAEAGVVGVEDEEWGQIVAAVVVPRPGHHLDREQLAAYCAERLPAYKRPSRLVVADRLPRTSTGKLLRRELAPLVEATPSGTEVTSHG